MYATIRIVVVLEYTYKIYFKIVLTMQKQKYNNANTSECDFITRFVFWQPANYAVDWLQGTGETSDSDSSIEILRYSEKRDEKSQIKWLVFVHILLGIRHRRTKVLCQCCWHGRFRVPSQRLHAGLGRTRIVINLKIITAGKISVGKTAYGFFFFNLDKNTVGSSYAFTAF